jgi:uncharacterized UPF0160 family protein
MMEAKSTIIPRSFGTHDGTFHADEVTACALLLLFDLIDKDKIKRTRDPNSLSKCDYVCDVGGIYDPAIRRFDHHQSNYQGSLSSAGMILQYLRDEEILDKELYQELKEELVKGVDAHDNGIELAPKGVMTFSHCVSNFQPISYESSIKDYHHRFFDALDFAFGQLKSMKERFEYIKSFRGKVESVMAESSYVLIFEESLPWLENFFHLGGDKHPALFVIMPTGNHWKLRGIPPNLDQSMKVRLSHPEEWAGLHDEDLVNVSGIDGGIFCHKGGFISIWKTKKDAMHALHHILQGYRG